jgi:hypothetical protein
MGSPIASSFLTRGEIKVISKYDDVFRLIQVFAIAEGFSSAHDDDHFHVFDRKDGARIVIDGDRYAAPAIDLRISNEKLDPGADFSVRFLMKYLEQKKGERERCQPSIQNQLDFLRTSKDIFRELQMHKEGYAACVKL